MYQVLNCIILSDGVLNVRVNSIEHLLDSLGTKLVPWLGWGSDLGNYSRHKFFGKLVPDIFQKIADTVGDCLAIGGLTDNLRGPNADLDAMLSG